MEIGHVDQPVVASLKVSTPRAPAGVLLREHFKTEVFDTEARILKIRFEQQTPGQEPASFTLDVDGNEGSLAIDDRLIKAPFGWEM
ncbi:hypothetical protein ABB29_12940 [Pseudoxanthomonas dokdonensis]|uniref:Uncharacterized protein n=2 Tax=Pseudoxanthomonas dokdonensis TaxID=344882 RepID=A0A0R0CQB0_9GAMM|nr:hypothetical protein ABB29_12940 [Pseudoxanthomonas dokdonensis]